jgi:hypothetical protein
LGKISCKFFNKKINLLFQHIIKKLEDAYGIGDLNVSKFLLKLIGNDATLLVKLFKIIFPEV